MITPLSAPPELMLLQSQLKTILGVVTVTVTTVTVTTVTVTTTTTSWILDPILKLLLLLF